MIFKETHQLIPGHKWQTRRPVKAGEYAVVRGPGKMIWRWHPGVPANRGGKPLPEYAVILEVRDHMDRLKWKVGKDYAIQIGRGKRAIRRTPPIKTIRCERLQEISMEDAFAEGVHSSEGAWAVNAFEEVWERIYHKPSYRYQGFRWRDNPEVWVLEFEKVKEEEDE